MNRSHPSEFEGAIRGHLLFAAQMILGAAWKLTVPVVAVAIALGIVAGPDPHSGQSAPGASDEPQRVRVVGEGNKYRIFTKVPSENGTTYLEIIDPNNEKHFTLAYTKDGLFYSFSKGRDPLQMGYSKQPGGGQTVNVRTPVADYRVELKPSGATGVSVVNPRGQRAGLGEVWISPEGEVRSEPIAEQ